MEVCIDIFFSVLAWGERKKQQKTARAELHRSAVRAKKDAAVKTNARAQDSSSEESTTHVDEQHNRSSTCCCT
jgi:hypothetical protein